MGSTTNENKAQVGDVMIYVTNYGAKPMTTNVDAVTKAGWIKIINPVSRTFKSRSYSKEFNVVGHGSATLYVFSEEKMSELQQGFERSEIAKAEKKAAEEKHQQEYAQRLANELAEVKAVCNDTLPVQSMKTLPDGSRLVMLNAPIRPGMQRTFDVVIVRLVNVQETDWDGTRNAEGERPKITKVEAFMTYCNDKNSSFSSCSGVKSDTDDEALWNSLRDRYNDSW